MNIRIVITVILFLIMFGNYACNNQSIPSCKNVESWYDAKIQTGEKLDTGKILKDVSLVISNSPNCMEALMLRARLFLLSGQIEYAKSDFLIIHKLDTQQIRPLFQLGMIYKDELNFDSAIYHFKSALKFKTHNSLVIDYNLENDNLNSKNKSTEITAGEIIYQLGLAYYYAHDRENARQCFNSCIQGSVFVGNSYLYLGAMAIEEDRLKEGCDFFSKSKFYGNVDASNYLLKYCK